MKTLLLAMTVSVAALLPSSAAQKDSHCYELRTYRAAPGKMEALHKRFREHTLRLFARHGITSLGYWERLDKEGQPISQLTFLLSYSDREARENSWKAFLADPEWQAAAKASEAGGPLLEKDGITSIFMQATDYSPVVAPGGGTEARTFELRIYKCEPGRLPNLHERFRNHTVKLFSRHGMTNFGYWTPMDPAQGADDTLIYILAHKSREAAAASFKAFREDPDWVAVRKASEEKAGGSLTVKDGVTSVFMKPTDYSPTK
ncbi:MAG TPA: NIPSNAP family protein [Verrucomicrobiae bacterium]|nr:NIPSNAP family protein [Verrucomicrobiae bacterium]